jgi:2-oxoisovalerate dehydrogenase E2 component (dihydrolipoyl transacylase)
MYEFKLPDIGEGMHEGEIRRWLVREGQRVAADEPLVEVQTDKVTAELTAPVGGVVEKLCVTEGTVVPVGTVLAVLAAEAANAAVAEVAISDVNTRMVETSPERETPTAELGTEAVAATSGAGTAEVSAAVRPAGRRALATPHVRSLARKLGLNIDEIPGTGPAGRVTEEDVRRFAERKAGGHAAEAAAVKGAKPAMEAAAGSEAGLGPDASKSTGAGSPAGSTAAAVRAAVSDEPVEAVPLRGIRRRIAEHMVKSVQTIPHVTHVDEVEMDALDALRQRLRPHAEARGVKLTFLPFFIKALTVALREFPYLNASVDDAGERILLKRYYHIGVAVDTEEGLIVPVIKHADQKSVFDLAAEIADLSTRARAGRLALHEVTGSTFTVSNVGPIGGLYATPIINHPEAAILGMHKMEPRAVVRDGELVIRKMMYISLSFDHRIIDGAMAVRFTNRLRALLEQPETLWAELR